MGNELEEVYVSPATRSQPTLCCVLFSVILLQAEAPLVPMKGRLAPFRLPCAPVLTLLVVASVPLRRMQGSFLHSDTRTSSRRPVGLIPWQGWTWTRRFCAETQLTAMRRRALNIIFGCGCTEQSKWPSDKEERGGKRDTDRSV